MNQERKIELAEMLLNSQSVLEEFLAIVRRSPGRSAKKKYAGETVKLAQLLGINPPTESAELGKLRRDLNNVANLAANLQSIKHLELKVGQKIAYTTNPALGIQNGQITSIERGGRIHLKSGGQSGISIWPAAHIIQILSES
jgi:hypothetical protein